MIGSSQHRTEVLLVDDNPADIDLTSEILARGQRPCHVNAVMDGDQAMSFLRHQGKFTEAPHPDLTILDLNLPGVEGCSLLAQLKSDRNLSMMPVVIFTTSQSNADITRCYELGANCYLAKPGNLADYVAMVQSMADFWLGFARLPH